MTTDSQKPERNWPLIVWAAVGVLLLLATVIAIVVSIVRAVDGYDLWGLILPIAAAVFLLVAGVLVAMKYGRR